MECEAMTKVMIRFRLQSPLAARQLARLADARSLYGILDLQVDEPGCGLAVEYDASRLRPEEVAAVLHRAGIPVLPD